MASNLYDKASLKEDLKEMIDRNTDLAALYIKIATGILSFENHGTITDNPQNIKISNVSLDVQGDCSIQVTY